MRAYDAPMSDLNAEIKIFVSITTLIMVSYIPLSQQESNGDLSQFTTTCNTIESRDFL